MRTRQELSPKPQLRSRNQQIIYRTLLASVGGVLMGVLLFVQFGDSSASQAAAIPLPGPAHVTLTPYDGNPGYPTNVETRQELMFIRDHIVSVEQSKALRPLKRGELQALREKNEILKEIEDHELRISLQREQTDFDPKPYINKIAHLRARVRKLDQQEQSTENPTDY